MKDPEAVDRLIARGCGTPPQAQIAHLRKLLEQRDRELLALRDGQEPRYEVEMEGHTDVDDALTAAFDCAPEYLSIGCLNEDDWILRTNCALAAAAAARASGSSVQTTGTRLYAAAKEATR